MIAVCCRGKPRWEAGTGRCNVQVYSNGIESRSGSKATIHVGPRVEGRPGAMLLGHGGERRQSSEGWSSGEIGTNKQLVKTGLFRGPYIALIERTSNVSSQKGARSRKRCRAAIGRIRLYCDVVRCPARHCMQQAGWAEVHGPVKLVLIV